TTFLEGFSMASPRSPSKRRAPKPRSAAKSESKAKSEAKANPRARSETPTLTIDPTLSRTTPHLNESLKRFAKAALTNPRKSASTLRRMGGAVVAAARGRARLEPAAGDRRFEDPAWRENVVYRRLLQGYLGLSSEGQRWIGELALPPRDEARARMVLGIVSDTLAPTNTLLGNPAALKRTLETGGENLRSGARAFARDWRHNGGLPASVDASGFGVGKNLAAT